MHSQSRWPVAPARTLELPPSRSRTAVLQARYRALTADLASACGEPEHHWGVLSELALVRKQLREHGVLPAHYGITRPCCDTITQRTESLVSGILRHFGTLPAMPREPERLAAELWPLTSWEQASLRVTAHHGGAATVQEDVLSQELTALVPYGASGLEQVLTAIRLMRARDTALACWSLLRPLLEPLLPPRPTVVSLGSGLAQLENLFVHELTARVCCIDVTGTPGPAEPSQLETRTLPAADLYHLPPGDADLLLLKDMMHHVRWPQLLLPVVAELVRPGGHVLVIEPRFGVADHRRRMVLAELDETAYPQSILPIELWERWFTHVHLDVIDCVDVPAGTIDNNDSFPRAVWILTREGRSRDRAS